jgi:hypothetical protein
MTTHNDGYIGQGRREGGGGGDAGGGAGNEWASRKRQPSHSLFAGTTSTSTSTLASSSAVLQVPRLNMLKMNAAASVLFPSAGYHPTYSTQEVLHSVSDRLPNRDDQLKRPGHGGMMLAPMAADAFHMRETPRSIHGGNTELNRIGIPAYNNDDVSYSISNKKKGWLDSIKSDIKNVKKLPEYDRMTSFAADCSTEVNISHRKFGDDRLYVIACGLRDSAPIRSIDVSDNRMTDKGFELVFQELCKKDFPLEILDLSENTIRRHGCDQLTKFIQSSGSLRMLTMQNIQLENLVAKKFVDALQSRSLVSLTLQHNHLEDLAATAIANLLLSLRTPCSLTELDISWNKIGGPGGIAIVEAMRKNTSITSLDISWNALATAGVRGTAQLISKHMSVMFQENKSLTHLDISNNHFSSHDCSAMSVGLKQNHTLLGIHITGNGGSVDANGELLPDATPWPLESGHAISRIIGGCVTGRESWSLRSNCWICGGWREYRFTYTLSEGDISRHLRLTPVQLYDVKPPKELMGSSHRRDVVSSDDLILQREYLRQHEIHVKSFWQARTEALRVIPVYLLTSFDKWVPELTVFAEMMMPSKSYNHAGRALITTLEGLDQAAESIYRTLPRYTFELYRMVPPGKYAVVICD